MTTGRTLCAIFMISALFISGTASAVLVNNPEDEKLYICNQNKAVKWTVMYYMCGDSNMDPHISPLLDKLSIIGSSHDLNIIVLKDNIGKGNSRLYYIDEFGEKIELNDIYSWPDEVNMNDLNTLQLYCIEMMTSYPADHYALITYTSAGGGWQEFYLQDKDAAGNKITTPEFANSLKYIVEEVNHKLDVLFVSCAMNTMELAYEIAPYVDYIVGTQDCFTEKSIVPRFSDAVWDLKNNSDISPEEFCSMAPYRFEPEPFDYDEGYYIEMRPINKILNKLPFEGFHTVIHYPSSSVINLSKINELKNMLNDLASNLIVNLKNDDFKEKVRRARWETQQYSKCYPKYWFLMKLYNRYRFNIMAYDCVVDLYNFVEILYYHMDNEYIKNQCTSILEYYEEVIPAIKKISYDNSNGISIYFPKQKHMYNRFIFGGKMPCPYENLKFSEDSLWDDFLVEFLFN